MCLGEGVLLLPLRHASSARQTHQDPPWPGAAALRGTLGRALRKLRHVLGQAKSAPWLSDRGAALVATGWYLNCRQTETPRLEGTGMLAR